MGGLDSRNRGRHDQRPDLLHPRQYQASFAAAGAGNQAASGRGKPADLAEDRGGTWAKSTCRHRSGPSPGRVGRPGALSARQCGPGRGQDRARSRLWLRPDRDRADAGRARARHWPPTSTNWRWSRPSSTPQPTASRSKPPRTTCWRSRRSRSRSRWSATCSTSAPCRIMCSPTSRRRPRAAAWS